MAERATAYLRVKEYKTKPRSDVSPNGGAVTLTYGEAVTLEKKEGDLPIMYLVSTKFGQAWVPEFYLTGSKKEIDFLLKKNRVPATMSFLCRKSDFVQVYGLFKVGPLVVDSQGMPASADGNYQVSCEGNAVVFDETAVKYTWRVPIVMRSKASVHKLDANRLYYCSEVSEKGDGIFDCIALDTMAFCED